MPRAEGKVELTHPPAYSCEAWLEASPSEDGCTLQVGTRVADKIGQNAFLVTVGVVTERLDEFTEPAPLGSDCHEVECYRYYVHFAAVMGIGVSVSKVAGVSSTIEMARHDHYIDLKVCSDGRSSSNVRSSHTSGPAGDTLKLTANNNIDPPTVVTHTF